MPSTADELRAALAALSLDSRGNKDTLKRRLLRANKSKSRQQSPTPHTDRRRRRPPDQHFDSFLVFDVEATCERIDEPWGKVAFAYPNEIIEWPVILLQWQRVTPLDGRDGDGQEESDQRWRLVQVAEFHSYVKPTWATKLSAFCTELTGITQADLSTAPTFPGLCTLFHREFIERHHLFTPENRTVWVTDGPWDLRDFVAKTCYLSSTPRPAWLAGEIIDLRMLTSAFFATVKREKKLLLRSAEGSPGSASRSPSPPPPPPPSEALVPSHLLTAPSTLSLPAVLAALSLPAFEGRLHSGLADARNASRILVDLAARGMPLATNRRVPESAGSKGRERRWPWMEPGRGRPVDLETVQARWEEYLRKEQVKESQIAALISNQ